MGLLPVQAQNAAPDLSGILDQITGAADDAAGKAQGAASDVQGKASGAGSQASGKVCGSQHCPAAPHIALAVYRLALSCRSSHMHVCAFTAHVKPWWGLLQASGFGSDISGAASKAGDKAQGAAQKVRCLRHACPQSTAACLRTRMWAWSGDLSNRANAVYLRL